MSTSTPSSTPSKPSKRTKAARSKATRSTAASKKATPAGRTRKAKTASPKTQTVVEPKTAAETKPTPDAAELLAATGKVLARDGLEGLTVRAIAREAGTTTMAIYSRLGGKDGVLEAVNSEGFLVLNEAFNKAMGDVAPDPEPRILAFCRTLRGFARAFPNHYRVMLGTPPDGYRRSAASEERARGIWILLRRQVARLVGEGTATMDTYSLFALCHGLIELEGGPMAQVAAEAEAAFNAALIGALSTMRRRVSGAQQSIDLFSHLNAVDEPVEFGELAWRDETPRNAPCPCGSGKRYKHCHGVAAL